MRSQRQLRTGGIIFMNLNGVTREDRERMVKYAKEHDVSIDIAYCKVIAESKL